MPKNEEGEFELVLGNRQLISVFLIVVILLGVFFSMGYIVGRNSTPALPASELARNDKDGSPQAPGSAQAGAGAADADASPAPESARDNKEPAPAATAPDTTQPAQSAATPAKVSASAPAKAAKPAPFPATAPEPERASLAGQPGPGDYWQVVATARPDAEIVAEALNKKGFHASLAPAPREGIFRVLVGPLPDAPTQAQARTNLEAAGFRNPILRKY